MNAGKCVIMGCLDCPNLCFWFNRKHATPQMAITVVDVLEDDEDLAFMNREAKHQLNSLIASGEISKEDLESDTEEDLESDTEEDLEPGSEEDDDSIEVEVII